MPSKARTAFDENVEDIKRLLELHAEKGGKAKGRRFGLEVLNKSAIVLLTSFWEAYCEDVAAEALDHLVTHSPSADKLPTELRKLVAKELKSDPHDLAIWGVAGDGWRSLLKARLNALQAERNRRLNTPKAAQIDKLFLEAVGISRVSDSWKWPRKMTADRARGNLDMFVELRGSIAHRGAGLRSTKKADVVNCFEFLKRLAAKTGGAVQIQVRKATDRQLWT